MSSRSKGVMKEEFRASKIWRVMLSPAVLEVAQLAHAETPGGRSQSTNSANTWAARSRFAVSWENSVWNCSSFGINQRMRASTFGIRLPPYGMRYDGRVPLL